VLHTGKHGQYWWLVSEHQVRSLVDLVVQFHSRLRLCVTSFDSAPLRPTDEEVAEGWSTQGDVAISPPIINGMWIPHEQYDEWYLFDSPNLEHEKIEVFVGFGRFTLAAPAEVYDTFDPTWERSGLDWIVPIQERFWLQLERLKPESYVAIGWHDILASRNEEFIRCVREASDNRS
jgi:hypothetical protein